jgi:hypothetical protein
MIRIFQWIRKLTVPPDFGSILSSGVDHLIESKGKGRKQTRRAQNGPKGD